MLALPTLGLAWAAHVEDLRGACACALVCHEAHSMPGSASPLSQHLHPREEPNLASKQKQGAVLLHRHMFN